MNERRRANSLAKIVGLLVGLFSIIGTLLGAGIAWGQHVRADADQDRRLTALEERIYKLEWAHDVNHPQEAPLHEANIAKEK